MSAVFSDLQMSAKKRSTFGLRLDQLADLFGVVAEDQAATEADCAHEHLAEILRRQLTEVMPGNSLLLVTVSIAALKFLPASLADEIADPHGK